MSVSLLFIRRASASLEKQQCSITKPKIKGEIPLIQETRTQNSLNNGRNSLYLLKKRKNGSFYFA
jgi:hypothetical protein